MTKQTKIKSADIPRTSASHKSCIICNQKKNKNKHGRLKIEAEKSQETTMNDKYVKKLMESLSSAAKQNNIFKKFEIKKIRD